ncbi:dentin sialophosphoprotein-like [Megalops cyprinoides]|uniref:dentin sialophosphoprotein-like n=1 Tax=Megalops cyprinoides TaxID=118141 RepID=UPI001863BD61|nr:dentin sialophosphoprotein-like [Megalops cyprinoides]
MMHFQEEELDFEPGYFNEADGEGSTESGFGLPALTEEDENEDLEETEGIACATNGTSDEEPMWSRAGFPCHEEWGETVNLGRREDEDRCEIYSQDEDLAEDTDEGVGEGGSGSSLDSYQTNSFGVECLGGDQMEDTEDTQCENPITNQGKEFELLVGDVKLVVDSAEEEEERVTRQADTSSGGSDSEGEEVIPVTVECNRDGKEDGNLFSSHSPQTEDREVETSEALEDEDKDIGEEDEEEDGVKEDLYQKWPSRPPKECSSSESEDSLEDHEHQCKGDLKEFSEADCGIIGEGYAEYPSEEEKLCGGKETKRLGMELGELPESVMVEKNMQPGGKLSEWELMEKEVVVCEEIGKRGLIGGNKGLELDEVGEEGGEIDVGLNEAEEDMDVEGERNAEEKMMVLNSSSMRKGSEGDGGELRDSEIELEPAATLGEQPSDKKEEHRSDTDSNSFKKGQEEFYDESLHKPKQAGEEWDHENIPYDIKHNIIGNLEYGDEEGVCCLTDNGGNNQESSADGRCSEALLGWSPGLTSLPVSPSERDGSDSNLDSSLSDVDPFDKASDPMTAWTHDVTGLPAIRVLSTSDPDLQLDSESEEGSASQFLSSTEAHRSPGTGEGEFGNEEEDDGEEERNWEQERERIEAFYRYYNNDPDEDDGAEEEACGRSGRKHMVRFCLDSVLPTVPLQQDSDSSDMDVVSSSSGEREDSDTAETDAVIGAVTGVVTGVVTKAVTGPSARLEVDGATHREKLSLFLQEAQVTQAELKNLRTELRTKHRRDRISRMLMSVVKLSLVSMLGVLMFWWATDQLDWIGWV